MFDSQATTLKTLNNIKKSLKENLKNKYNIDNEETVNKFLKIHGLGKQNFDFISSIESVINENLNDVSIDSNSNKNEKTIEAINQECVSPIKKAVGYDYLYRQLKDLYGPTEASFLIGEMMDLSLGLSDSTNILKPYCWAVDASKIITFGRDFGQLHSKPAKRVSSYISALCETVHQLSSHLAGAIAIGSFFLDIAHLSLYKEKFDLREIKTNKKYRKVLENEMQQFVHSVNHLSRSGAESPFTNLSIFDRLKLRTLVQDMNWYFPFDKLPINHPKKLEGNEEEIKNFYLDYIVDFIIEIQDVFLDFFDKGDPLKGGAPYRFPVVTLNFSKKWWGDRQLIQDEEFLKNVCRRDIYRYNIFVSEGTKVASCCRLVSNTEMLEFASQSNSFGGSGISLGSHRVCTINFMRIAMEAKSKEEFYSILDSRMESAAKILKAHKELIKSLEKKGLQPFITNGWIVLNRLFSTFGILGIYEAAKVCKKKFGNGKDVEGDILIHFNNKVAELSKKYSIIGNIEQIPGESFAIRLSKSDKLLYGEENIPYELYSNQWIPLWSNATIWDKMDADGKYNSLITGGCLVHIQIGEKVTAKQAEKIIKYSINSGAEHFALNSVYSECVSGHCMFGKHTKCPECGADIKEYFTRVVGFFTPVSSWQDIRREWEFPKRTFCDLSIVDETENN